MKKQVIIYVDIPDDAPTQDDVGDSLNTAIEEAVEEVLPNEVYMVMSSDEEVEIALAWGGVTVRDEGDWLK